MDRKQMCVTNVKYKKPTQNEAKRMKNLLGYLTYRDSRDDYVPQVSGVERWVDRGMGHSVKQIADRCESYQSEHVLLFSLVVNPNPDLIRMVPHEEREAFVRHLTERTVEGFFDARGIDTGVEYSYVTHHRQTDGDESPGQHNPHTHIVLPGTYYDADEGRRRPLYFSKNREVNHIDMIHEVTQKHMADLMDRYAGLDWEQRYDALANERERQQTVVYDEEAHGVWQNEPVWAGVRRTDDDVSAAGVYGFFKDREGKKRLQFRLVQPDLDHEEAERLAEQLKDLLKEEAHSPKREDDLRPTPNFDI
ncbi:MAG: hypothetical protein K8H77_01405 [Cutibacterium acnes]|nr:hypothetical protein [Cutibacterium acnes]